MIMTEEELYEFRKKIAEAMIRIMTKDPKLGLGSSPQTLTEKREKEVISSLN
jgi:hypothetical protein